MYTYESSGRKRASKNSITIFQKNRVQAKTIMKMIPPRSIPLSLKRTFLSLKESHYTRTLRESSRKRIVEQNGHFREFMINTIRFLNLLMMSTSSKESQI